MRWGAFISVTMIAGGVAIASPAAAQEADVPPNIACMRDATDAESAAYVSYYTDHFDYQPGGPIPDPTEALGDALASHLYRCMAELDWDDATMSAAFGAQTGYLVEMGIVNSMPVSTPGRLEVQEILNRISMRDLRILSGEQQADSAEQAQAMQAMTGGSVVSMEKGATAVIENYAPQLAKARLIRIEGLRRLSEEGKSE